MAMPTWATGSSTEPDSPACSTGSYVQRGPWYLDVGYHIASALTVEDRRRTERDLLAHYLEHLAREGGPVLPWDEAWTSLAYGILYGFFLWAITLKVKPAITSALLERLGTAMVDHDVYVVVAR